MKPEVTAQDIVEELNAGRENYYGDRPFVRSDGHIGFGKSYVRYEAGEFSNNREGKARALTIAWIAVQMCQAAKARILSRREEAAKAPAHSVKVGKALEKAEIGRHPRSASDMLAYIPAGALAKLNSTDLAELLDSVWEACQDAKSLAND